MIDVGWKGTCSIDNPKDWHVTFARNRSYLKRINGLDITLGVFVPKGIDQTDINIKGVLWSPDYFEYEFALLHNAINESKPCADDAIDSSGTFRVIDGIREVNAPDGSKIHLKHMGNVTVGKNVIIGHMSFIERAIFDSTIIEDGARIDSLCVIGHNSVIGENTVIASGVGVGGSAKIGHNCWIGGNSYIRNGVKVCDGTVIGCMSAVVKDITEPGVYAGVPARFIKPVEEGWNF